MYRKIRFRGAESGYIRIIRGVIGGNTEALFVFLILFASAVLPRAADASVASFFSESGGRLGGLFTSMTHEKKVSALDRNTPNLQTLPLPRAAMNIDPNPSKGGGDVTVVDDSALLPDEGPSGTIADIVKTKNQSISIYVVQAGNTLSEIAEMFDVSVNTIKWANNISASGNIRIGQTLVILPVDGVKYKVKKGDTLASIAKSFRGDADEISNFNEIAASSLVVGMEIIIPDGELAAPRTLVARSPSSANSAQYVGYYLRPVVGSVRTQGIHGYNGVDLAAPAGTPILAAASGDVIVAKGSGWNGGYGQYIVVKHDNGTQTLYSHESSIIVGVGQRVVQGQVIGYVGSTGRSTGAHVHFEIRGGPRNPF